MRSLPLISLFLLASCASTPHNTPEIARWEITYYDRDHDGRVDFELHRLPGAAESAWAFSDTHFRGRYDVKLTYSYVILRERVDMPVPRNVPITRGEPPVSIVK
jgi:hypothetical protein